MRLTKNERNFLSTLSAIANKLLDTPNVPGGNGSGRRTRRSATDVTRLKREIRLARRKKVPVRQIAEQLGLTTSYIYQLDK
jgi:hypothetical protein